MANGSYFCDEPFEIFVIHLESARIASGFVAIGKELFRIRVSKILKKYRSKALGTAHRSLIVTALKERAECLVIHLLYGYSDLIQKLFDIEIKVEVNPDHINNFLCFFT